MIVTACEIEAAGSSPSAGSATGTRSVRHRTDVVGLSSPGQISPRPGHALSRKLFCIRPKSRVPHSPSATTTGGTANTAYAACLLLIALLVPSNAQDANGPSLFHVRENGRFGYIDAQGHMVLETGSYDARSFSDGLAAVLIDGRYGFIDTRGKLVIQPIFSSTFGFSDGLASATLASDIAGKDQKELKAGYIDTTGKYVIAPQFDSAFDFSDGMAQVSVGGRHGYVDKAGKVLYLEPLFGWKEDFSEGLAVVGYTRWGKEGYIDKTGRVVIEPIYDGAKRFSEGLAAIGAAKKWGYIDKSGQIAIQPQFDSCGEFSEGVAPAKMADRWGYIDKTGKIVIEPQFVEAREFKEGLAAVRVKGAGDSIRQEGDTILVTITGPFGFIDKKGRMVIEPVFTQVADFSHGLAMINLGEYTPGLWGRWAYIDKSGKYVWRPKEAN